MSKRSLFWGQASGKLGETVYYRAGGEQRARTWIPRIKNPRTVSQAANRISMLNLVSSFKAMRDIIRDGFPLKPTNQSGFNAFVSANKNYAAAACDKNMLDNAVCVPLGLYVSKGDLRVDTSLVIENHKDPFDPGSAGTNGFVASGITTSTDDIPVSLFPESTLNFETSGAVWAVLHGTDNPMNLPSVFKVTVVASMYRSFGSQTEAWQPSYITIEAKQNGTDGWRYVGNPYNVMKYGLRLADFTLDSEDVTKTFKVASVFAGLTADAAGDLDTQIRGIIISYSNAGKITTTTTRIYGGKDTDAVFPQYFPGGEIYNIILDEYTKSQEGVLSTK